MAELVKATDKAAAEEKLEGGKPAADGDDETTKVAELVHELVKATDEAAAEEPAEVKPAADDAKPDDPDGTKAPADPAALYIATGPPLPPALTLVVNPESIEWQMADEAPKPEDAKMDEARWRALYTSAKSA